MNRIRSLVVVGFLALAAASCHPPPSIVTPQGHVAYNADQIVRRVNELQNAAIQAEATQGLATGPARIIVQFCVAADKVLKQTPQGWQTTVAQLWVETKNQLPLITNPSVLAAIQSVDAVLAALGV